MRERAYVPPPIRQISAEITEDPVNDGNKSFDANANCTLFLSYLQVNVTRLAKVECHERCGVADAETVGRLLIRITLEVIRCHHSSSALPSRPIRHVQQQCQLYARYEIHRPLVSYP